MLKKARLIEFNELNMLLELYKHLNPEDKDIAGTDYILDLWKEIYEDPNLLYFVIDEDGKLVASCTISIIKNLTREGRPYGLIENVVTHKDYRKRGYGKEVLQKAIEVAKEKNCYKVMLLTGRKEESTLRFYEEAGFVRGKKTGFIYKIK